MVLSRHIINLSGKWEFEQTVEDYETVHKGLVDNLKRANMSGDAYEISRAKQNLKNFETAVNKKGDALRDFIKKEKSLNKSDRDRIAKEIQDCSDSSSYIKEGTHVQGLSPHKRIAHLQQTRLRDTRKTPRFLENQQRKKS